MIKFLKSKPLICLILLGLASIVAMKLLSAPVQSPSGINVAITNADGKLTSIDQLAGETTVLHFWATWCTPCIKELPELDAYIAQHQNASVRILPISLDGPKHIEKVQTFLQTHQLKHIQPYVAKFSKVSSKLNVRQLPATIVIRDGNEISRTDGLVDWSPQLAFD